MQPSRLERRWLQAAVATCGLVAALLTLAALILDPRHPLRVGSAAALAGAATLWGIRKLQDPVSALTELRIGADGHIRLRDARAGPGSPEQKVKCVFAAPWLITLRSGSRFIRLWPDSLPPETFRRVYAYIRWERAGTTATTDPTGAKASRNEIDP